MKRIISLFKLLIIKNGVLGFWGFGVLVGGFIDLDSD